MPRIAACLGGAVLTAALTVVSAPAEALEGAPDRRLEPTYRMAGTPPTAPPALVGPSRRTIHTEVVSRKGRLLLRGEVEEHSRRPVVIQRKVCKSCRWRRHEAVLTSKRGGFRSRIDAPRRGSDFWRAKVRASGGYATSFSTVWETYY